MRRTFEPERGGDAEGRPVRVGVLARCTVPELVPVRAGGHGRRRLRRLLRGRRRIAAAGLAVAAAAMAATAARGDRGEGHPPGSAPESPPASTAPPPASAGSDGVRTGRARPPVPVSAPVRIADAATVGLLRPGDRVDVIAGTDDSRRARVVAQGVRVVRVPKSVEAGPVEGALVVLRVPRSTAAELAGAAVAGKLAVTLC